MFKYGHYDYETVIDWVLYEIYFEGKWHFFWQFCIFRIKCKLFGELLLFYVQQLNEI